MIIQALGNVIYTVFTTLLSWVNLPSYDNDILSSLYNFFSILFDSGGQLISFFIPHNIFSVGIPLLVAIFLFEYLYYLVIWILKKIPIISVT